MEKILDCLVVGSGASSLALLNRLPDSYQAMMVYRLKGGASLKAQGGIAASKETESHTQDTLEASSQTAFEPSVRTLLQEGHQVILDLIEEGMCFTQESGALHLHQEGGHSQRRVYHTKDQTGFFLVNFLFERIQKKPNIQSLCAEVLSLIQDENGTVFGVWVMESNGSVRAIFAKNVILATGGASGVYERLSFQDASLGSGMMLAYEASAKLCNLEFQQFHPTVLVRKDEPPFLLTEALRGEGGVLLAKGEPFMHRFHPKGDMAPRDIVARGMHQTMQEKGLSCIDLDLSAVLEPKIHFPALYQNLFSMGFDMKKDYIPVAPAAHFSMGGVESGLDGGTGILGLYAIGECAYTGLHGVNRLASNSLLECLVMAKFCAETIVNQRSSSFPKLSTPKIHIQNYLQKDTFSLRELRALMWRCVGLSREKTLLEEAETTLHFWLQKKELSLLSRRICLISWLITKSALQREESIGAHYRPEFPKRKPLFSPSYAPSFQEVSKNYEI